MFECSAAAGTPRLSHNVVVEATLALVTPFVTVSLSRRLRVILKNTREHDATHWSVLPGMGCAGSTLSYDQELLDVVKNGDFEATVQALKRGARLECRDEVRPCTLLVHLRADRCVYGQSCSAWCARGSSRLLHSPGAVRSGALLLLTRLLGRRYAAVVCCTLRQRQNCHIFA